MPRVPRISKVMAAPRGSPFLPTVNGDPIGPKMAENKEYPQDVKDRVGLEGGPSPIDTGNPFHNLPASAVTPAKNKNIAKRKTSSMVKANSGYHPHAIHLSKAQQRKLVKGLRIRIPHKHLGFVEGYQTVPIHLNALQMRRFQKAHEGQRGLDFQFQSQRQREMHGKGWFGDLWKGIKNVGRRAVEFVKPVVTEHVLPAIQQHVLPRATNYATNLLENRIAPALAARADLAAQRLADRVESGVNRGLDLVDQGASRVGLGIGRGRKRGKGYATQGGMGVKGCGKRQRKMQGGGFFDDVWSGVKSVASHAAPIATNLLVNRALGPLKALTGGKVAGAGVRGRRMHHGKIMTKRGGSFIVTGARG